MTDAESENGDCDEGMHLKQLMQLELTIQTALQAMHSISHTLRLPSIILNTDYGVIFGGYWLNANCGQIT